MNVEIIAAVVGAFVAAFLGAIIVLLTWIVQQIFTLQRRLGALLIVLEDHLGITIPEGDTKHLRRQFQKRSVIL